MIISFDKRGWEDYVHWQEHNPALLRKVNVLIRDIVRNPFRGLGKPEPLKENGQGYWSRRIDLEHRLVYKVEGKSPNQNLIVVQARMHY